MKENTRISKAKEIAAIQVGGHGRQEDFESCSRNFIN